MPTPQPKPAAPSSLGAFPSNPQISAPGKLPMPSADNPFPKSKPTSPMASPIGSADKSQTMQYVGIGLIVFGLILLAIGIMTW